MPDIKKFRVSAHDCMDLSRETAYFVLSGGMGVRLGHDDPLPMYIVNLTISVELIKLLTIATYF